MHCDSEETTKQALILPVLDILGFSPYDPTKVKAEYGADVPGVKSTERVDYALFCGGVPVMFVEAKGYRKNLTNKVRLCERSEPQSEPFVGQARPVQRWSKNTEK